MWHDLSFLWEKEKNHVTKCNVTRQSLWHGVLVCNMQTIWHIVKMGSALEKKKVFGEDRMLGGRGDNAKGNALRRWWHRSKRMMAITEKERLVSGQLTWSSGREEHVATFHKAVISPQRWRKRNGDNLVQVRERDRGGQLASSPAEVRRLGVWQKLQGLMRRRVTWWGWF